METVDVVIAGAGIIGLSLALDLAAHRLKVAVLERGSAMEEASWAAAGMLAAYDPENAPELRQLAHFSLQLYPAWLAQLESLSGQKIPRRTSATLQALHRKDFFLDPLGSSSALRKLSPAELRTIDPHLQSCSRDFLLIEEQSLDPRDLCAALPRAARAAGVTILENSPALSIDSTSSGVIVQSPRAALLARHAINAAGAWASLPALAPRSAAPEIIPCKGQMVTVRLRGPEILNHVLRAPEIYLVPRGDGRVLIGATIQQAGFDKTVEPRAIASLLRAAAELWPPITDAETLESWAGLRPASADGLPLIGPLPAAPGRRSHRWIASGHFRNGILLAPGTARALSQLILNQQPEIDLAPFHPSRTISRADLQATARSTPACDNPVSAAL